jgi:hypothetical protein
VVDRRAALWEEADSSAGVLTSPVGDSVSD